MNLPWKQTSLFLLYVLTILFESALLQFLFAVKKLQLLSWLSVFDSDIGVVFIGLMKQVPHLNCAERSDMTSVDSRGSF